MLQPAFIGPGRARVAVNNGFRSLPGSEREARVSGQFSETASVRRTKGCVLAPALGILCFSKAREISESRVRFCRRKQKPPDKVGNRAQRDREQSVNDRRLPDRSRRYEAAKLLLQPRHVTWKTIVPDGKRLAERQRFQIVRHLLCVRHGRSIDQNRKNRELAL